MIIWKGHGILILVFGILGAVAMGMVAAMLFAATHWSWVGRLIFPANCWGAAIAIWLYAKTMGKTVSTTYLDPATRQPVVFKSSHSLFFIPAMPWAILATLLAVMMTLISLVMPAGNFGGPPPSASSSAAKTAFDEANRLIAMDKGEEAFGNTPEAKKMAEAFSMMVKMGREMGVQKTKKKSAVSLSHGKFLSYCRINPESCVFMVHVPDLRKFSDDAKKFMVGMAWTMARQAAAELRPQPTRLAVGIRGALLYDTVVEGPVADAKTPGSKPGQADDEDDLEAGIEQTHSGFSPEKYLEPYFETHPAGAVLPVIGGSDVGRPVAEGRGSAASSAGPSSLKEFNQLVEKFTAQKEGQAEGNSPAAKALAAAYAEAVRSKIPFGPAIINSLDHFSAYVHLRQDTAAFMLGVPGEGQMPPGGALRTRPVAWFYAAMAAAQMTPRPTRIALIYFEDGQMAVSYIGVWGVTSQGGSAWKVEEEIEGTNRKESLLPFFSAASGELIAVNSPVTFELKMTAGSPAKQAQVPAASPSTAAPPSGGTAAAVAAAATQPVPAPLPTAVRDWKDTTGRVMQASLESFTTPVKDTGRFKRADGQAFDVPFARLSAEDQQYIQSIAQKVK